MQIAKGMRDKKNFMVFEISSHHNINEHIRENDGAIIFNY